MFAATKHVFCRDKKYACRDKTFVAAKDVFVATNISRDKRIVAAKIFCRDEHNFVPSKHTFVPTKDILNELGHGGYDRAGKRALVLYSACWSSLMSWVTDKHEIQKRAWIVVKMVVLLGDLP